MAVAIKLCSFHTLYSLVGVKPFFQCVFERVFGHVSTKNVARLETQEPAYTHIQSWELKNGDRRKDELGLLSSLFLQIFVV